MSDGNTQAGTPVEIPSPQGQWAEGLEAIDDAHQRYEDSVAALGASATTASSAIAQERAGRDRGNLREVIAGRYQLGRLMLGPSRHNPDLPSAYHVAEAARFNPPASALEDSGAELPNTRTLRIAEVMRLNAQVRRGVPTLLARGGHFEGGIPEQDGFALVRTTSRPLNGPETEHFEVGIRLQRRGIAGSTMAERGEFNLADVVRVWHEQTDTGTTVTVAPTLEVITGHDAIRDYATTFAGRYIDGLRDLEKQETGLIAQTATADERVKNLFLNDHPGTMAAREAADRLRTQQHDVSQQRTDTRESLAALLVATQQAGIDPSAQIGSAENLAVMRQELLHLIGTVNSMPHPMYYDHIRFAGSAYQALFSPQERHQGAQALVTYARDVMRLPFQRLGYIIEILGRHSFGYEFEDIQSALRNGILPESTVPA